MVVVIKLVFAADTSPLHTITSEIIQRRQFIPGEGSVCFMQVVGAHSHESMFAILYKKP